MLTIEEIEEECDSVVRTLKNEASYSNGIGAKNHADQLKAAASAVKSFTRSLKLRAMYKRKGTSNG